MMIIMAAAVMVSLFQTFVYIKNTPLGTVYPLVHNYEQDYYWYLSLMRQGWEGNMFVTTRYTPESFPPMPINTFFTVLGVIGRISSLTLPVVYILARIGFGWGLLYVSYRIMKQLKLQTREMITAMILLIAGTPFWWMDGGSVRQAGEFWTGFDPILRISWLPHHLAANMLFSAGLIFIGRLLSPGYPDLRRMYRDSVITAALFMAAAWINPATLPVALFTLGAGTGISLIQQATDKVRSAAVILTVFIGLSLVAWALLTVQNSVFPWTAFRDWERFVGYPIDATGYLNTLGIAGVLSWPGILIAVRKKSAVWNLVVGWFVFPFAGLAVLQKLLPISNGRYLQTAGYIPAALLSALTIAALVQLIRKKVLTRVPVPAMVTFIWLVIIGYSIPAFVSSLSRQMAYMKKNLNLATVMVPTPVIRSLNWLSGKTTCGTVMAPDSVSVMVPAFTSCRVVSGHPTFTYRPEIKRQVPEAFYFGQIDTLFGQTLRDMGVTYIMNFTPENRRRSELLGYVPVYDQDGISLYRMGSDK